MKRIVLFVLIGLLLTSVSVSAGPPRRGILGDVNRDGLVDSMDALIVQSAAKGMNVAAFCPMNCGDVTMDGRVNGWDAMFILWYDVGFRVPYPIGIRWCPRMVWQPPSCR